MNGEPVGSRTTDPVADDAKDAGRYRWLRAQFEPSTDRHERDELVRQNGPERTYVTRNSFWHSYHLQEDWRFGRTTDDPYPPSFDSLVDAAMREEQ